MKSIERKFNSIAEKNPNLSSYICFAKTVEEQGLNIQTIHRWFKKLVNKDDYEKSEKRALLENLANLSGTLRTTGIRGKNAPQSTLLRKID
jgi:hypothetical protein